MKSNKVVILLTLISISLALLFTYYLAENNAYKDLHQRVENQLIQVVNELKITLERHSYLPAVLSSDINIIEFLKRQDNDPQVQQKINLSLEYINNISESAAIYIMRPNGVVVASSNWESPYSFIGKNLSFRPYFKDALQNKLGRYYAVGAISGTRGYFFASSIISDNKVIGVITVKVAIDDIEFTWGQGAIDFMVTDANGVIFLSSQKDWNLKSLLPLSSNQKTRLAKSRRYGKKAITALKDTSVNINLADGHFQHIKLLAKDYEMLSYKMKLADWNVHVIASHKAIKKSIFNSMLVSTFILLLLSALITLLWRAEQQRKKYQQQIQHELEKKVVQRTQALKQSQEDLIQAAKMAALGQLSAGMAHEINNPLTAIRAYADNAQQFLQKDRLEMVSSNLAEIISLTETMAAITQQLKSFSRKSKGQIRPIIIGEAIKHALAIVHPKIISHQIICHWDESQKGINKKVLADELWLGQILVNLLSNAISATHNKAVREVWIKIKIHQNSQICISIKDNGAGIDNDNLSHIFEPFFTTKASSKGLGLGLSISFSLAKDMQGSLTAKNHPQGGAVFNLCLPTASKT